MSKLFQVLGSRFALNTYFWIIMILVKIEDALSQDIYSDWVYARFMLLYMAVIAAFSYFNNLYLIPKFYRKKKKVRYFLWSALCLLMLIVTYVTVLKVSEWALPNLRVEHLSIITYMMEPEFTLESYLELVPGFGIGLSLWWIMFSLAGMFHDQLTVVKRMEAAILEHREAELSFLRGQINPHFLFNTLNNLYALSMDKSELTPAYILKLSTVFRYILYEANTDKVPFATEQEIMQSFIDIELLRTDASPNQHFVISADHDYLIPPLIWLPILENLFKHTRLNSELEIDFRFTIQDGVLNVYCRNNKVEGSAEQAKKGGIGLENLKKRLELLYPGTHRLEIRDEGAYFTVEVEIRLNS